MREWAIQNAELWTRDYQIDGLRLDAVHAIYDDSKPHVLAELKQRVDGLVISEMNVEDLRPLDEWGHDAMWLDSLHHELHVLLTGERTGYYEDFGTIDGLVRELRRDRGRSGSSSARRTTTRSATAPSATASRPTRIASRSPASLFSLSTPLVFMGEEYDETRPFQFFTDHIDPAIAEATREGRRARGRACTSGAGGDPPDPQAVETFERSKLEPREPDPLYRELLALRRDAPARARRRRVDGQRVTLTPRRPRRSSSTSTRRPWSLQHVTAVLARRPFPLGPTCDGEGTNFALFSEHAERVELCLFDDGGSEERVELTRAHRVQLARLPARACGPGQRYAYRVHGPWAPEHGHRFNAEQAAARSRTRRRSQAGRRRRGERLPYVPDGDDADLDRNDDDDAHVMPKCVVIDPNFDWEDDDIVRPRIPWHETVIYEAHVKGFTIRHPNVRDDLRGTYGGLASEGALEHLKKFGVDRGRVAADPPHRRRGLPPRSRSDELLGLLDDRLPRAARALLRHRTARRAGARVQGHGEGASPRGHRGDPRRRLQPHRGGQPPRPDARLQGDRQRSRTTG